MSKELTYDGLVSFIKAAFPPQTEAQKLQGMVDMLNAGRIKAGQDPRAFIRNGKAYVLPPWSPPLSEIDFMNVTSHQEAIKCPQCQLKQFGTVTYDEDAVFATYIHHCTGCAFVIMESDWEHCNASEVKP